MSACTWSCLRAGAYTLGVRNESGVWYLAIPHESSPTADVITISAGVFTLTREATYIETVAQLIQKVDENLYMAKNTRNSVSHGEV